MLSLKLVIVLLATFEVITPAKILGFFPLPWKSHQFICRSLVKALAGRGHQVDYYTTMPMPDPPENVKQYELTNKLDKVLSETGLDDFFSASPFRLTTMNFDLHSALLKYIFIEDRNFNDLIKSNNSYDLVITEPTLWTEPISYLAHRFGVPFINLDGAPDYPWTNEASGLPDNPSYVPSILRGHTKPLNFIGRLLNFYTTESIILNSYWDVATRQQALADEHFKYEGWESRPKLIDMTFDAALVLINSHVSFTLPTPKAPHVKEIGGIHIDYEPLPKDLQTFMDDAPDGIIYFSLGSVLDPNEMLADGKFDVFLKVFRKLKQKIMWKVASVTPSISDPKIKLQSWYPQQSILAHKNVVLFITHGGLQSTVESINFGVPCIAMPVFFDQIKNADFMVASGSGLRLSFENVTETALTWSITEVLTNPSYKQAAQFRKKLFNDRPMKPRDEAVYWVEYVLKYGKVLQPASVHMSFYQLYLLDIFATLLITALVVFWATKKIICSVISRCFPGSGGQSKKSRKKND